MSLISYAHNSLLTTTEGNYKIADVLVTNSQQTLDRVGLTKAEVLIQANILKPFSTDYNTKYQINVNLLSVSFNGTKAADTQEKDMIKTLRDLDVDVQHFYKEDTPEYKIIFGRGRSINYKGLPTHTQIQNYRSISMNMDAYPLVSALQTAFDLKIDAFADAVKFSYDSKTDLDEQSTLLETARVLWCEIGYKVIGGLMIIYYKTPEKVGDFFDLSIFNTRQSHIDPDKDADVIALPINTVVAWDKVYDSSKTYQIHNCGLGNVLGGSMLAATTHPILDPLTWLPDETKTVDGTEMGDIMNRFLGFLSEDTNLPGEIKIKEVPVN